ncbi:MAG: tetratricopeptide repeat protein [Lewinellaceae bacterium]|nr:tetratricopeptide repeat protein [Lewinellaceae bacterium]
MSKLFSTYAFELTRANQSAEAEQVYKKLLNLDPQNINAMANLIAVYYRQNKTAEAERQLSVAIQSGKMDAGAYSNLGIHLPRGGEGH